MYIFIIYIYVCFFLLSVSLSLPQYHDHSKCWHRQDLGGWQFDGLIPISCKGTIWPIILLQIHHLTDLQITKAPEAPDQEIPKTCQDIKMSARQSRKAKHLFTSRHLTYRQWFVLLFWTLWVWQATNNLLQGSNSQNMAFTSKFWQNTLKMMVFNGRNEAKTKPWSWPFR